MSEDGLLRHIKMPGGADRFDHMLLEHHHIICTRCGCFADAPASGSAALDEAVARQTGYSGVSHDIVFRGYLITICSSSYSIAGNFFSTVITLGISMSCSSSRYGVYCFA